MHGPRLARLEAHGSAGGDVETEAARRFAIKVQPGIGFVKVIVRADLDRPVTGVGDDQRDRRAAGVEFEFAGFGEEFSVG